MLHEFIERSIGRCYNPYVSLLLATRSEETKLFVLKHAEEGHLCFHC